ncbi:MAG TPA: hypothetical protein VE888_20670 [Streptosporangiaceae bacterium]|nr:hypothetical protein [Streptosporangiaceae bacterium]
MISGLHHYALEVPDLAVAEGFLQDFGLETGEKDGSLVAMCPGRQQEQVRLVEAPAKRLHHVTFTLRPGTTDAVREALERSGTPVIEPPPGATEDGLWLRDPTAPPCNSSTNPRRRPGRPPRCWSTWAAPASGSTSPSGGRPPRTCCRAGSGTPCCSPRSPRG